ncbi:MAG: sigma 54-interacting transcriptional regulator [Bacillota bacterium]
MNRLQRTHQLLSRQCSDQRRGLDAAELAGLLGAARHNVSADLNELWRRGLAVKIPGRPVLFWDRDVYQRLHGTGVESRLGAACGAASGKATRAAPSPTPVVGASPTAGSDPLTELIGAQDSLRGQVEQARAAVLYPPAGLHTLLVGPTGVGKSLLAERMHQFAIASSRLPAGAPLVTLNCADYANNPQLLMAHLFGAVKGAYTGADKEQIGLVDHAHSGILFLDEVHRLPAEGQEMLFRLIDKGVYRRLGETGQERHARVMIIAATTERPDSALLRTFARRIPMVIALPALSERTVEERFRFVRRFLRAEATKIGVDIVVPHDTLRMLLEYECLGNVGQLKTDVQLACARLFLEYLTQPREPMELTPAHLPEHVQRTVPPARQRSREAAALLSSLGDRMVAQKRTSPHADTDGEAGPISFYGLIEQQMQDLTSRGMSGPEAEKVVRRSIASHFKGFVDQVRRRHQTQRQELSNLVGQEVLRAAEKAVLWAEERLGRALPEQILYALALHVRASVERLRSGQILDYSLPAPPVESPEAKVAEGIVELLGRELHCTLPAGDAAFAAMLLAPDETAPAEDSVGVAVVAHGRVASAMVDVAHALTATDLAQAVDMPLDEDPAQVQDRLVNMAKAGRFPGGLLLLADMGSPETMGEAVAQRAGIQVRTIGMASTPLVLEAVHQASIPGATLDQVYHAVLTARASLLERDATQSLPQVVLTFCFTGAGSAHTLARMVRESLGQDLSRVEVIPSSIGAGPGWNRLVSTLLSSRRLLAAVGPFHPHIPGVPYVSTEEMVVGQGARRLRRLAEEGAGGRSPADGGGGPAGTGAGAAAGSGTGPDDRETVFLRMAASLGDQLKVTNPAATVPVVLKALRSMEQYLERPMDDELRVGLTMHLVCLLERKVQDRLLQEPAPAHPEPDAEPPAALHNRQQDHRGSLPWLPATLRELTDMFHIRLTREELARLDEIIRGSVLGEDKLSS